MKQPRVHEAVREFVSEDMMAVRAEEEFNDFEAVERDYYDQPELDQYSESGMVDAPDLEPLSVDARRTVEREMAQRDQLMDDEEMMYDESGDESTPANGRGLGRGGRRGDRGDDVDDEAMEEDEEAPVDILENIRGRTIRDHVSDETVALEIERRFKNFFLYFTESEEKKNPEEEQKPEEQKKAEENNKQYKYIQLIKAMAAENKEFLEVNFLDIARAGIKKLFKWLIEVPIEMLELLNRAAWNVAKKIIPSYTRVCSEIKVRISNLPIEEDIRMLRQVHLNMLIRTAGVVTIASGILPQLNVMTYSCSRCLFFLGKFIQQSRDLPTCPWCRQSEIHVEKTVYHNYQRITMQEPPNKVAAGRLPRSKDVILLGDLCDSCKPGDEIEVTGVYTKDLDGCNEVIYANYIDSDTRKLARRAASRPVQTLLDTVVLGISTDDFMEASGQCANLMRSDPTLTNSELQIQHEDFPALPGVGGAGQSQLGDQLANMLPDDLRVDFAGPLGDCDPSRLGGIPRGSQEGPLHGIVTHPDGKVTNIPASMLYGQSIDDPSKVSPLDYDLKTLGLSSNTQDRKLHISFGGPWEDAPIRAHELDVKLPPLRLNKVSEEMLFYIFYYNEIYQDAAASELYHREWRFHKSEQVWLTRSQYGGVREQTGTYEKGHYNVFDQMQWRKIRKELKLEYKDLTKKPKLPQAVSGNGQQQPPHFKYYFQGPQFPSGPETGLMLQMHNLGLSSQEQIPSPTPAMNGVMGGVPGENGGAPGPGPKKEAQKQGSVQCPNCMLKIKNDDWENHRRQCKK